MRFELDGLRPCGAGPDASAHAQR